MACPRCGSWSVRADRSLAGRMVCGRCGTPLQGVSRGRRRPTPRFSAPGRGAWRWWLLAVLALSASLATLTPESAVRLWPRPPGPGATDRPAPRWP